MINIAIWLNNNIPRDMFENEMRAKEEEFMTELARKDELFLTTVCQMEDRITELQERHSVNIEIADTPRVMVKIILSFIIKKIYLLNCHDK